MLLKDVGVGSVLFDPIAAPAIAKVGPLVLDPLIKPFRSSNDNPFASESFLPVNSLINDWY